jgi:hypothetical protein
MKSFEILGCPYAGLIFIFDGHVVVVVLNVKSFILRCALVIFRI